MILLCNFGLYWLWHNSYCCFRKCKYRQLFGHHGCLRGRKCLLLDGRHRERQVKKKLQQEKRQLLLAGGLALLLDHWKKRRLGCAHLLPFSSHEMGTFECPDSWLFQSLFCSFQRERASPDKFLDKLEGNVTALFFSLSLSPLPPLLFSYFSPHKTSNEK